MKLGIMQPYFLPYIGYFQLIAAVDKFVILDDVNYINRGWINRNRLLINGAPHTFTIPLSGASQNKLICDIELAPNQNWRPKLLRTISQAYLKAPCFDQALSLIERIINHPARSLDHFVLNSLLEIAKYIDLDTEIVESSRVYCNAQLRGQARIINICNIENADCYINSIGGIELYQRECFAKEGMDLKFIQSRPFSYAQGTNEFEPWLSILDVLMFNPKAEVKRQLVNIDLI